jgi:hypothetical protein
MWALTRLPEFSRAHQAAQANWDGADAATSLQFAQGLLLSCFLVTPFWLAVALVLIRLTR